MEKIIEGILGTSGNPIHEGHIMSLLMARQQLGLDRVRLMINPHNPLKDPAIYAPFEHRLALARHEVATHTKNDGSIVVCDFEARAQAAGVSNETIAILPAFEKAYPDSNPVWLMGADILASMHTWGGEWNRLFEEYPMVVFARPGDTNALSRSVAARAFSHLAVRPECFAAQKGQWTYVEAANHPGSSTAVRALAAKGIKSPYISDASFAHMQQHGLYGSSASATPAQ